ncbi:GGDEF domain-containing protein [Kangiella profundi]|uniref:diguanylate cyclase n=1 Tax=Kangiella profundi TaxID=1561924 RepID=A0A2K9B0M5_9GAMM|nr:diguanylate cyclase [Kangiella profundi]AUD79679.1 GGDEF domain-containing protein [Kangiella profundi]
MALLFNSFLIAHLYGNLSLHFGQIFIIFCLVTRGLYPAAFAALLGSIGLYVETHNPAFFVNSLIEILVLYALSRRGWVLLVADVAYWLVIGIPITYVFVIYFYGISSSDFIQVIMLKQLLNGVLVVSAASLLRPFLPSKWHRLDIQLQLPKLSYRIFELSMISILLPSLIITLILSNNSAKIAEQQASELLGVQADHYTEITRNHLTHHQRMVDNLANTFSWQPFNDKEKLEFLLDAHNQYPDVFSMLITDEIGYVIHGAPQEFEDTLRGLSRSEKMVDDRLYYQVPYSRNTHYISDVFQARGYGNDPIVAISAPYFEDDQFAGIVQATLNLANFEKFGSGTSGFSVFVIVTDAKNKLVYASEILNLEPLSEFVPEKIDQVYTDELPLLKLSEGFFLFKNRVTDSGWKIYTLSSPDTLIDAYKNDFYNLIVSLLIIASIVLLVVQKFSKQITRPLETIVKHFSSNEPIPRKARSIYSSAEIESVREQLQQAQHFMLEYQKTLQEQVEEKTKELLEANEKLALVSVQDELTQIYNRRGFDQNVKNAFAVSIRHATPVTMAILDIDHFKNVNDQWGHAAGDQCIIMVAEEMKKRFKRDSDFVARYGGEEFVVFIAGGDINIHRQMLEELRLNIANHEIYYEDKIISITVSIGAYSVKDDLNITYDKLVSNADKLLYKSKTSGRNQLSADQQ